MWQGGGALLHITLVDVPSNDWNKVAQSFAGPNGPARAEDIFISLVPKSFYAVMLQNPACMRSTPPLRTGYAWIPSFRSDDVRMRQLLHPPLQA